MGMLSKEQQALVEREMAKPLPDEKLMKKGGRNVVWNVVYFLMRLLFRIEVEHPERVPAEGPVLLCGNHVSYLDLPLIHLQLNRWTFWVARESLFRSGFAARFLPWWGSMPIDVHNPEASQIKNILASLRKNRLVGIFPQGTRCKDPEKLRNTVPRTGAVSLAIRTGAQIVPVAIDGTFKVFRKTRLIVGEPFRYDLPKNHRHTPEELMTLTIDLMEHIFGMMGKEYPLRNKAVLTDGRKPDHVETDYVGIPE